MEDYRTTIQAVPQESPNYWTTVADFINYQSQVNQRVGIAPDPAKISTPCVGFTGGKWNSWISSHISACIADIDDQYFKDVTFKNSVIRYSGGTTSLIRVTFINCRFIINLPPKSKPESSPLLLAILKAGDKDSIQISYPN